MNYPDKENTLASLRAWARQYVAVTNLMDGIEASIGLDPNGPMFDTVWSLFDAYTNTIAAAVGDHGAWMQWHHIENNMGALGYRAGYDGKTKTIKTLEHLYWLIAESRKRGE